MSEERLSRLIEEFSRRNLNLFLRSQCENYAEAPEDLSQYDDERFTDFQKLGEIRFDSGDKLVITSSLVNGDLSERSGKKAQYEKAKKILKELAVYDAGFFIFHDSSGSFRFSLVYGQAEGTRRSWNNFRRFTYFVSKDLAYKTFRIRVGGCAFSSLETIKDAFSVEKVNKEFYNHIAGFFYRLTGYDCKREMTLPSVSDDDKKTYQEFAVRLIGRTIFCWFLKHKKSANGVSLIPESILSSEAVKQNSQYYHSTLEKLFFEVLNTPQEQRHKNVLPDAGKIPFLNGGLFEPHKDFYDNGEPQYNLVIPDVWFEQFLEILEQYNFTIDENSTVDADVSVDPEMLGRIFENLLAEVNPETGETARKSTGSYYTPRTIVDYMVDQSLKQYLVTKAKIDEDRIIALLSYEAPEVILSESEKGFIISALDEIKIIDPACGSGAFPMGILHKVLLVLEKIDSDLTLWLDRKLAHIDDKILRQEIKDKLEKNNLEYIRKLLIIRDSIYGVDIQQIAVEISKLRVFLSLIVDEKIDDTEKNRDIKPLPNLEFKFVAANSLIGLPKPETDKKALIDFEDKESIEALARIRDNYFTSYGEDKVKTEQEFIEIQEKMFQFYLQTLNQEQRNLVGTVKKAKIIGKTATQMLSEWEPFSNKQCEWFDPKWMFGVTDGFDIVIANPPYLGEKGHKEIFRQIKQGTLKEYYQGKMDIFYFFFHLSIDLGNTGSQIAFITTNYYSTATGASKLRRDFKKRTIIRKLVNFNELKIFESAQGQHNMLTILSKGQDDNAMAETCITKRNGYATPQALQNILSCQDDQTSYNQGLQKDLYDGEECYLRLTGSKEDTQDPVDRILNKVKLQGIELSELCNINAGADVTISKITNKHVSNFDGDFEFNDGVFVLGEDQIRELKIPNKELKIVKPFIKNSNINKYFVSFTKERLLYLRWEDNIDDYPGIKKHLARFKEILEDQANRYEENYPWFALHRPREQFIFEAPEKILVPYRCKTNVFGYSVVPLYSSRDVFFITEKDKSVKLQFVLALLNSRLYYLWLYYRGKRKGESLELYWKPLSEIPIKKISKLDQKPFISVTDKILAITKDEDYPYNPDKQAKVKEYERQIDKMVYELYGLTPEEIAVVEGK